MVIRKLQWEYGLCKEDFRYEDLDYRDEQYPLTVVGKITK